MQLLSAYVLLTLLYTFYIKSETIPAFVVDFFYKKSETATAFVDIFNKSKYPGFCCISSIRSRKLSQLLLNFFNKKSKTTPTFVGGVQFSRQL